MTRRSRSSMTSSGARDITVAGAELAGEAIAAGLVDECRLFLVLAERRFRSGVVHLHYALRPFREAKP